jgi:hypothetical protein
VKTAVLNALVSLVLCPAGFAAEKESLPDPVGSEKLTFQQIEQQKDALKYKIVLIEIGKLLG